MCSYGTGNLEDLTSHVCRMHQNDPKFHVYCKSCFRSYTKWDSYRKHIQRGCTHMPSSVIANTNTHTSNNLQLADINDGEEINNNGTMEIEEQPASLSVISPDD